MQEIKIGIIGVGNIGSSHAACIYGENINGLRLVALCDINPDRLSFVKNEFKGLNYYLDYKEMIKNCEIDAVIISVPHPFHSEIAEYTLKSGLHTLVEKPIDISCSKAIRLNKVAKNCGKAFCIMFNQRTNPLFIRAREIVKDGKIGEIMRSNWTITNWYRTEHYYHSGSWRATWAGEGGGVLLNQAPHNLDLWQWICGMPESITAFCNESKYHNIEVEDEVTIFAKYKNGATGTFITSTGEYPGTNRLEIVGSLGKIVLESGILKLWLLKESVIDNIKNSNIDFDKIEYEYFEDSSLNMKRGHSVILQNFADHILHNAPLISPGFEGINELSISNAAYLSSWLDNKAVSIPFDNDLFDKMLYEKQQNSSLKELKSNNKISDFYSERWNTNW